MVMWNVCSLKNNEQLDKMLQILDDRNINVSCFTETWMDCEHSSITRVTKDHGFNIMHSYRSNNRGGGAAIIYKSNIVIKHSSKHINFTSFEYTKGQNTL